MYKQGKAGPYRVFERPCHGRAVKPVVVKALGDVGAIDVHVFEGLAIDDKLVGTVAVGSSKGNNKSAATQPIRQVSFDHADARAEGFARK